MVRRIVGAPLPGVEHRIVEVGTEVPVRDGEPGEICVRGEDVCVGMLKRERSTVFDADGWYHAGDLGRFDGGELFFMGRLSDTLKASGMNVTPREVELAIESLEGVQQAVVVGIPHADRGQEVAAAVVPAAGVDLDSECILNHLRPLLSSYKLPRHCPSSTVASYPHSGTAKSTGGHLPNFSLHAAESPERP